MTKVKEMEWPIFKKKIILFSIFVIFNNFHKQHKCNNRLTNNSINNCSFCFLFHSIFLKVFPSVDFMLEPKKNGRHQRSTSRPRAQRSDVNCSQVWRPLGYPGAPRNGPFKNRTKLFCFTTQLSAAAARRLYNFFFFRNDPKGHSLSLQVRGWRYRLVHKSCKSAIIVVPLTSQCDQIWRNFTTLVKF